MLKGQFRPLDVKDILLPLQDLVLRMGQGSRNYFVFEGPEGNKTLALNSVALQKGLVGNMIALCLVQGQVSPRFLSERLYRQIADATHVEGAREAMEEATDELSLMGSFSFVRSLPHRDELLGAALNFLTEGRILTALNQFKEGLETFGILALLRIHHEALKGVFMDTPEQLLASRQLQATVSLQLYNRTGTAQGSSSATLASPSPGKKFKHTPKSPMLKKIALGNALLMYQRASLGCKTGKKENARTLRSHAQRFCTYMQKGAPAKRGMRFLFNLKKLQEWPLVLKRANYQVTTIKNMMYNVKGFLKHVKLFHRSTSKITGVQMGQIQQTIKALQSDILRDVLSHRQTIKKKSRREVKNWKCVQYGIDWEKKATSLDLGLVQGYLTGYVAILTGHRPVVFNSLKKKEVGEHKTQRSFGHAQVALFEEEYGWLRRLMDISNCLHKDSPPQA
ncbi:unnamed protein product [Boreogadus saida]